MILGELLTRPDLRFDFSSTYAKEKSPKKGLIRFGPYDLELFSKDRIKAIIFYPQGKGDIKDILVNGLVDGEGYFNGFKSLFKISLEFIEEISYIEDDFRILIRDTIAKHNIDIIYFILEKNKPEIYRTAKLLFTSNGIPSQVICVDTLANTQGIQYILENIALASYAKVGGIPWTISTEKEENILLMGISRTKDDEGFLVGFITIFSYNGDFLLLNSAAPIGKWEEYLNHLTELIIDSIKEYEMKRGSPSKIVLHISKRPGRKEIKAMEDSLQSFRHNIPYALIHLNEYSNFRVFDSTHPTYVPPQGLMVRLSSHEALLIKRGRLDGRGAVGIPRVLNVRMDKRSTIGVSEFLDLVKNVHDLCYVNWRGFNARSVPITLNYSKLIARMIRDLGGKKWNELISKGKLRDKSWYL